MNKQLPIKLILTLLTIYFAAIPIMVDMGEGHLFNPDWAPHSKLHLVWFLLFMVRTFALSRLSGLRGRKECGGTTPQAPRPAALRKS